MKKAFITFCLMVPFFLTTKMYAQFEVSIGPSFPVGLYLDEVETFQTDDIYSLTDGNYISGARIGLDVGLKYRFKLYQGLQAFVGANLIWNPVKKTFQEQIENDINIFSSNYKVRTGEYFQIPIMAGLNYTYNPSDEFGVFVDAGCGVNIQQRSPFEVSTTIQYEIFNNKKYELSLKSDYKTLYSFAFQAGIGAVVKNRFMLSVHYYGLGSTAAEGTTTITGIDNMADDIMNNISEVLPFIGTSENTNNLDKTSSFTSDKKCFAQAISVTFGIRFGECHKKQKAETSVAAQDHEKNTKVKKEKSPKVKKEKKSEKKDRQNKKDN